MRSLIAVFSLGILIAATTAAVCQEQPGSNLSAQDIVVKWRNAVHADKHLGSMLAVLVSDSNRDGIAGRVEEWVTNSAYRTTTKRDYDEEEIVVTPHFARQRDWNGFVRNVEGGELSRMRAEIFERNVILFRRPLTPAPVISKKLFQCRPGLLRLLFH
jgi:hypothetical protein